VCYASRMLRRLCTTIALACFGLASCKQGSTGDAADGTLVTPYLAIGDTLANDRTDDLDKLATLLVEASAGTKDSPGVAAIIEGAASVGTDDIGKARAAFERMSTGMITYLKADEAQQAGRMIVHCTMTFSGQGGAWVQAEGKVMNPYEGARMLHCGDKIAWTAPVPGLDDD
jgi:hypothetical protein